eukprot:9661703-Alexandrium_andersonii.AAC.1
MGSPELSYCKGYVPKPGGHEHITAPMPFPEGNFEVNGHLQLEQYILWALQQCPKYSTSGLEEFVTEQRSFGTTCSGTEAPMLVQRAWAGAMR